MSKTSRSILDGAVSFGRTLRDRGASFACGAAIFGVPDAVEEAPQRAVNAAISGERGRTEAAETSSNYLYSSHIIAVHAGGQF